MRAAELDEGNLRSMLDDRSVEVRHSMATSAVTPRHIRQALENDADEQVAEDARRFRESRATGEPAAAPRAGHRRRSAGVSWQDHQVVPPASGGLDPADDSDTETDPRIFGHRYGGRR